MKYFFILCFSVIFSIHAQKNLKFSKDVGYVDVTADGLLDIEEYAERRIDPWKDSSLELIKKEKEEIDRALKGQTWKLIVPREYNPNLPAGLLVTVNPFEHSFVYDQHWKYELAGRNMILLYPGFSYEVYNKIPFEKRSLKSILYEMTTLTGIKIVKKKYKINEERIYLADRHSNMFYAPKYADIFKGVIHIWSARKWTLSKLQDKNAEVPYFLVARKNSQKLYENWKKMGVVFIQTEEKNSDAHYKDSLECYKKYKFPNILEIEFDVTKNSNTHVSNRQLGKALDFLEKKNFVKAKLLSEKARKLEEQQENGYVALYKQAAILGNRFAVRSYQSILKKVKEKNEEMLNAFKEKNYPYAYELTEYVYSVWGENAVDAIKINKVCLADKKISLELKAHKFLQNIIVDYQNKKIDQEKYKAGLIKILTLCPDTYTAKRAEELKEKLD